MQPAMNRFKTTGI